MTRIRNLGIHLISVFSIFVVVIECVSVRRATTAQGHMGDVYDVLNRNDVWNRVETWQRPTNPQQKVPPAADLPDVLEEIQLNEFNGTVFEDNVKDCEILVVDFNATFHASVIYVSVRHGNTYVDMLGNTCGLGICFLHDSNGNQHRLILVQQNSFISKSMLPLVVFSMIPSLKDTINIELHPPGRQPGPGYTHTNVSTYTTPSFTIRYEQNDDLVFDPSTASNSANIVTRVTTTDGNVRHSSMSANMETGTDYNPRIQTQVHYDSEKQGEFVANVDLTDTEGNNGVLMTYMILNSRGNPSGLSMFITIRRLHMIHPTSVSNPQPLEKMTMFYGKEEYNITVGDVIEMGSLMYNKQPPTITWQKNSARGWQPISGFELCTFPFKYMTSTLVKSYSVSPEDSGEYMLQASSGGITKNVTYKLNIFEEHVEIESERREIGKSIVIICKSKGRPRPSIEFLETNHYAVPEFLQRPNVVLTSSDIYEIGPLDTSEELTTRQITIKSFPNPTDSGQGSFAVKCVASNGYETKYDVYHISEYEMS